MRKTLTLLMLAVTLAAASLTAQAQERRPIDSRHPLWLIHVDVWNKADPQKIIDLIPDDVKPYVCMNLSLSCQYDTEKNVYKMPQNAVKTYKSWGSVCQANGMWFTCQPASGGHTHIQDDDLETFEYFYRAFPNFLGWNYAEQFWGFDEPNDKSSSTQTSRIALFAKLVPMAHKYGGFLTVSFCGNIWSHPLNPMGMMKRDKDLLEACRQHPEAILWLYKYTTSSCFYNNESVTFGPFISGLAKNYGVRYDSCGWEGALTSLLGEGHGKKYPTAAGIGTVMEQTCVNGGAVWDGPELIWTEDFRELGQTTTADGYRRRNWDTFPSFDNAWLDMFRKIIDGTMYIPTREEVVERTKIVVINDVASGNDEQRYAAWGDLYDGVYKQNDPFNRAGGQWMDNFCYFKKTGRYATIPVTLGLYDDAAKAIPLQVKKSNYTNRWSSQSKKTADFNARYPVVSTGDLFVSRFKNQLVTYTPYSYMNEKKTATARIPLQYNTCERLELTLGKLGSGIVREYADHIDLYLNNYRTDSSSVVLETIVVAGATAQPAYKMTKRGKATAYANPSWDEETGTYTLAIKHMGPVDVTISCAGAATDRSTDMASAEPLSADLPKQPAAAGAGWLTVEAEDMDFKDVNSCVTDPYGWYPNVRGHAGNGFMDMGTKTTASITHDFKVAEAGRYTVEVRYTCSATGTLEGKIRNAGGTVTKRLACPSTGTNVWKKTTAEVSLTEGVNTITLNKKSAGSMYIDNVTLIPEGTPEETFLVTVRPSEFGTVTASPAEAAEGEAVSLTVSPAEGYEFTGWTVVHGGVTVSETGTFVMPDDNVTLIPHFKDMTAIYTLDLAPVLNGTVPQGWTLTQGGGEVHQYPNSYGSGARAFTGFGGYQGKGVYWRETSAEYGLQNDFPLILQPGTYRLTFAHAAWKGTPRYKAEVLDANGLAVAQSASVAATPNANGNTGADLSAAKEHTLEFTVGQAGKHVIRFTNAGGGFDEFLMLECRLNNVTPTGSPSIPQTANPHTGRYLPSGAAIPTPQQGVNLITTPDGQTRKVMVR